jgi:hypothetical protein
VRRAALGLLVAACAHGAAKQEPATAQGPESGGVEVQDAIHGVRYSLPPSADLWQVSREGAARSVSGTEAEVTQFAMGKPAPASQCRDQARWRLSPKSGATSAEALREESTADSPPSWSFTTGPASAPVRNRWAFFARGADCVVLHVTSPKDDAFGDRTFATAAKSLQVLELPEERQRDVDLLAGMGFLERREPGAAMDRFEALTTRQPDDAKGHFGALMAPFELGPEAYARALPHGAVALRAEHDLTPEQRQLALRAVGVMQLAQNQIRAAAGTLAELVVRVPDLAEGQYNYACALARLGDAKGAMDHLMTAVRLDSDLAAHAREDDDLKSLRGQPGFDKLVSPSSK